MAGISNLELCNCSLSERCVCVCAAAQKRFPPIRFESSGLRQRQREAVRQPHSGGGSTGRAHSQGLVRTCTVWVGCYELNVSGSYDSCSCTKAWVGGSSLLCGVRPLPRPLITHRIRSAAIKYVVNIFLGRGERVMMSTSAVQQRDIHAVRSLLHHKRSDMYLYTALAPAHTLL